MGKLAVPGVRSEVDHLVAVSGSCEVPVVVSAVDSVSAGAGAGGL